MRRFHQPTSPSFQRPKASTATLRQAATRLMLLAAVSAATLTTVALPAAARIVDDPAPRGWSELFRSLLPTVINITARSEPQESNPAMVASSDAPSGSGIKTVVGSGFIIDPSGIIVTNWHVVDGAFEIQVTFSDGSTLSASVTAASRVADIALLKVEADHPLPVVHWGDSDQLQVGDPVVAIGNPLGLGMSVSAGIISALNRDIMETPYDHFIQTDAAINHGNSGGPLFNMKGEVVGVDTALVSPTSGSAGLGFAIPARDAQFVIDRMRKYGWVHPSWLGLVVQQTTLDMAKALGMAQPRGSIVAVVVPGGPAEKAGIKVGDIVIRYGDKTPTDERALLRMIAETPEGQSTGVTVLRGGKEQVINATVGEWPRMLWEKRDQTTKAQPIRWTLPPNFGLTLSDLTDKNRAEYELDTQQGGVVVTGVASNTDAAERGLVPGDVILRVQDSPVSSAADVQSKLDAVRGEKRSFALLLVQHNKDKDQNKPGPRWIPLRIGPD